MIAQLLASNAIAMLMLSAGLSTDRALVRDLAQDWRFLLRTLAIVWLVVPTVALVVIRIVQPTPMAAVTLGVMAVCPGVPMVIGRSHRSQGDARTTLSILIATAVSALVMVPLWIAIVRRVMAYEVATGPREIALVVLPSVLLPFVAGRLVVAVSPRIAHVLAKVARVLFMAGIVTIVLIVIGKRLFAFDELGWRDVVAGLLVPALAVTVGYTATASAKPRRVSVAYAAALGNPSLAAAIISASYAFKPMALILTFVVLRVVALIPFNRWVVR
jgi:bile acid:Na+ symporter, BASS family